MIRPPAYPLTMYYDGACGLCRREMERFRAKDTRGRLRFVNANTPEFNAAREGLSGASILDYIHAKDAHGRVVRGVDAFAWLWQACEYTVLPILVRIPLVRQVAKLCYRMVARNRYRLNLPAVSNSAQAGGGEKVCGPECAHTLL